MNDLVLKHGLSFADLYDREGLVRLDRAFVAHVAEADVGLHERLMMARRDPEAVERLDEANLLGELAPHLEDFVGELFGIAAEICDLQARHHELGRFIRSSGYLCSTAPSRALMKRMRSRSTGRRWPPSSAG